MILTLDGERIQTPPSTPGSLQALIDAVRDEQLDGRIIVSVTIDGRLLVGSELSARLVEAVGDVGQVDLESADVAELGAQALRGVAEELTAAREGLSEIAAYIQSGHPDDAMGDFCGFLDAWRSAQQAMGQCGRLLNKDFTLEIVDGRPVGAYVEALSSALRELRDAFVARDSVLLNDLIEYDMPELCETWCGLLTELAGRIGSTAAEPANSAWSSTT